MRPTIRALAASMALLVVTGCGGPATVAPPPSSPGRHHDPADDPALAPAGSTGTPALGQPVASMADLTGWVQRSTGECANPAPASLDDLADYLGPVRVGWYEPFVAEWVTCGIDPYDKLGLVLFKPGKQRELQEFWSRAMAAGEIAENPDWAFGNGFAITAGPLGAERLGLRYLWCEPVDNPDAHTVPADVDGCVYATWSHHS